jgi:acetolactate synthase-1/2/3 large subunit
MMTGGKALVNALVAQGADHAFCVPGESFLAVLDALYDVGDQIKLVSCRQESGASNMAEAHGKMTGKPGICFVTRGPGATNAAIGVHTAFQDSTPMILFIGQVAADQVEREAFQEIDYRRMFGQMAKWVAQIDDPNRMSEYINRAFQVATSGRPGPVVLALPEDMLTSKCALQQMKPHAAVRPHVGADSLAEFKERLEKSERPVFILGGSGWKQTGVDAIKQFLANNNLAAGCAFRFQDTLANTHPNYIGDVGIGINPALAARIKNADLIVALGPRLGEMTTSAYTIIEPPVPQQDLIHIHAGAEELGRVYQADQLIHSGTNEFALAIGDMVIEGNERFGEGTKVARADYEAWSTPRPNAGEVQLAEIYDYLRDHLPEDAILTNGAGNYSAWLHRFYRYRGFKTQLAPTSGAMGYGVPAAIAAKIVSPEKTVVCCAGDGCFMMTSQELSTAMANKANVIFLVFNNGMYGTIRMHQEKTYPGRVSGTDLCNPDFVHYAKSFGLNATRVEKTADFAPAFEAAEKADKPTLIEIIVDPEAITPNANLSDLGK